MSEAYLYGINPRRPIKNLNDEVKIIRTNTSLFLTKEEVEKCLPFASVWRRFASDNLQKVTGDNIDRLHNEKFYSEDEWKQLKKDELGENRGKVSQSEPEPVKEEQVTVSETAAEEQPAGETVQEEPVPDTMIEEAPSEVKEPEPEVPVVTENENSILENNNADLPQHEAEETSEDSSDANSSEDGSETSADESSNIDVNSYNGKKKKHKH